MGIGPTRPAWKAGILPLNYTRIYHTSSSYRQRLYIIALLKKIVKSFSLYFLKFFRNFYFLQKLTKKCDFFTIIINYTFFAFFCFTILKKCVIILSSNKQKPKPRFKQQNPSVNIQHAKQGHEHHKQ